MKRIKWTHDKVKYYIEYESNSGCKLLSSEYIDYTSPITLLCNCGNEFTTNFSSFKNRSKRQCNKCGRRGAKKFSFDDVKNFIEMESGSGCKLISTDYIESHSDLKIQCRCGSKFVATFSRFKHHNKRQCNKCGYENLSKKKTPYPTTK